MESVISTKKPYEHSYALHDMPVSSILASKVDDWLFGRRTIYTFRPFCYPYKGSFLAGWVSAVR